MTEFASVAAIASKVHLENVSKNIGTCYHLALFSGRFEEVFQQRVKYKIEKMFW